MADEIKVSPTPIQRNLLDVATELTNLYYKNRPITNWIYVNILDTKS